MWAQGKDRQTHTHAQLHHLIVTPIIAVGNSTRFSQSYFDNYALELCVSNNEAIQ